MRSALPSMLLAFAPLAGPALAQYSPLLDTRWQLVVIQSMDDRSYTPEDPSRYTLALNADQTAAIGSDCNRAQGNWTSEGPGQLRFDALASSRARCTPDSLDERYRAQFEWVRSYILRNDHLFLATMADGSSVEFSPLDAPPVVGKLQGDDLRSRDPDAVQAQILDRLFSAYAMREGLEVSAAEVGAYLVAMDRTLREQLGAESESVDDLAPEEQAAAAVMRQNMARAVIGRWKVNRALFEDYGGRVVYQQFGPEPLDAYRAFLEDCRDAGDFTFIDKDFEAAFWRYFGDESIHDFYSSDEAARVFTAAPWEN